MEGFSHIFTPRLPTLQRVIMDRQEFISFEKFSMRKTKKEKHQRRKIFLAPALAWISMWEMKCSLYC